MDRFRNDTPRKSHARVSSTSFAALVALATACEARNNELTPERPEEGGSFAPLEETPHVGGVLAIRNVRVFDGEDVLQNRTVIVSDGRVVAIGPDHPAPAGARIIEGAGRTLLPGLIDAESHLVGKSVDTRLRELRQAAMFGVTTVLDTASYHPDLADVRDAASHPGSPAAWLWSGQSPATAHNMHMQLFGIELPWLDDPVDAAKWVSDRLAEGSDWIAVYRSSEAAAGQIPSASADVMAAAIAAARAVDALALLHASGPVSEPDLEAALQHGVNVVVHSFASGPIPQQQADAMAAGGVYYAPSLAYEAYGSGYGSHIDAFTCAPNNAPWLHSEDTPTVQELVGHHRQLLDNDAYPERLTGAMALVRQLKDAGVPILAGSDSPFVSGFHGAQLHVELRLLVEAGLTPREALVAATSAPAQAFGLSDRGRIAPGTVADLLLVEGDPTENIADTERIVGVFKGGRELDREGFRRALATKPDGRCEET